MRRFLVLGLAALLALAGCGGEGAPGQASARLPRIKDAAFVYSWQRPVIIDWDPATANGDEIIAMQNIYDTLTAYDPVARRATPRLARYWESSADGRTWTFMLRDGAVFHTGRPVDAEAVKESVERTRRLGGDAGRIWDPVQQIKVIDSRTVEFVLKEPAPLDLIASAGHGAYVYDTRAAGSGDLKKWFQQGRDAGSGPYTVADRGPNLVLHAYDKYWGGWEGAHYRSIEFRVTPDVNAAWLLLRRGEIGFVPRLTPSLFRMARATPGIRTMRAPSFQNMLVLFNTASGPLRDVRLRKALQKAIDYDAIIKALNGTGARASGLLPEGLLGHVSGMRPRQDLDEATLLLAQAGYGPGRRALRLSLTYARGDEDQRTFVTLLARTLKKLNITVEATPLPWGEQVDRANAGDPAQRQDLFLRYWRPGYADAFPWFRGLFHSRALGADNVAYLRNRGIDVRIDNLPTLLHADRAAAQREYAALQTELIDNEAVVAVPWVCVNLRAYLGNIKGYDDNPAYPDVVFVHRLIPTG